MNNKPRGLFGERPPPTFEVDPKVWRRRTRRDVVLFGTGTVAALASARSFLPNVNRIDDEVAETLYSPRRTVPTYAKSQITPLKNNYNGATPDPGYIPGWHLTLDGLVSGVRRPRYSQSHDSLLDTRADHASGLRRRLEHDCLVGWAEI